MNATITKSPKHDRKVGDIFYTSWGYDQTNVEFFEVVRVTPASVEVREVRSELATEGRGIVPSIDDDRFIGAPHIHRVQANSYKEWSLTIDYCRTAWAWDGTPKYDTLALGYQGH